MDSLEEVLRELGERHIKYGIKAHFFPSVGVAMNFALKDTMKDAWTTEIEQAWFEVYDALSGALMRTILNHNRPQ